MEDETWVSINEHGVVINRTVGKDINAFLSVSCNGRSIVDRSISTDGGVTFTAPQPYPSWVLDENAQWQAPVPKPDDGKAYLWDEPTLCWVQWDHQPPSSVEVVPAT